ncbi:MAG: L,D-transpeptidase family protein [Sphingomonas sp.]|nr:L,D-transpeptidase family protein [Sphingomonas sp.]
MGSPGRRAKSLMLFTALAGIAVAPVAAQVAMPPRAQPVAPAKAKSVAPPVKAAPEAPAPGNPDFAPEQQTPQPAPAPAPLPPAIWDVVSAEDLLHYIQQIGVEGLRPADYDPEGLQAAIASGDIAAISAAATARFDLVSSDLALGHVKKPARVDWFLADNDLNAAKQDALLRSALANHDIAGALNGLLPTHPQYAALKAALAETAASDTSKRDHIRLNMDRWRWLPRDLGKKYIIVNVPSFHATLVEDGTTRWKERAIAGKLSTPTPELSALATGVILNPWWEVPKSIEKEASAKKGFVPVTGADGEIQRWRQPPGPTNALGQLKFVMPNSKAIYLHDTNARSRFNDSVRALSHGCIRTQHVVDLATLLLGDDNGAWTPGKVQETLASKKTVQANFVKPLPVYIVYFTDAALVDGTIVDYKDMYGRDPKAIAALNMKDGGASLVPPKPKSDENIAAKPVKAKPSNQVATR